MKHFLLILFCCLIGISWIEAQGCVAIRGNSACALHTVNNDTNLKGVLDLQFNYRYFKSFRHFRGSEEEYHRIEEGTEVINRSHFTDLGLSYSVSNRWSINMNVPFVYHTRSSMYEHGGNPNNGLGERHITSSSGISDIRIESRYWIFKQGIKPYNYSVGLGVKLPTGSNDYESLFYNQGDNKDQDVYNVVDQSIQPGDGGIGLSVSLQGFHQINHNISWINNLYYLFNVEETNGVLTRSGSSEFSCPDQFSLQTGLELVLQNNFKFFFGGRLEGVPASDIIGGSDGYRRPGFVLSIEPGVGYGTEDLSVFCSIPIALYRNRTQSYLDKIRTEQTGVYRHGDAAFSDYLLNINVYYKIPQH